MPTPNAPDAAVERFRQDLTALAGPLGSDAKLGVAVSGGPDSLALLLLANAALPGQVRAATVNHGLRAEAAGEAMMVAGVCGELGIPHVTLAQNSHTGRVPGSTAQRTPVQEHERMPEQGRHDGERMGNVQHEARILRYTLLGEWARSEGIGMIVTAHHLDDVAESFLMRALRGSGVAGLARMRPRASLPYAGSAGPALLRPLLGWRRAELAGIAALAGLTPADDPSNRDPRFDRARIRALLAAQAALDPVALARAAANLADADAAIEWITDMSWRSRLIEHSETRIRIDALDLPVEIRRRLAARAIGALAPAWNGDGLDRLVAALDRGRAATLAGLRASGGAVWQFGIAPARRGHR